LSIITLQFQTPQTLSNFKKKVNVPGLTMNLRELILTGTFTDLQISIALNNFGATIVKDLHSNHDDSASGMAHEFNSQTSAS
jgi:hypothetical protein